MFSPARRPEKIHRFLQYRWFALAMVIYTISLCFFGVVHYRETRAQTLAALDNKLQAGALSLDHLLGEHFHDWYNAPNRMTAEQDLAWVLKVTALANELELEYIYAMVEQDGEVYFTAASANEEELRTGTYQAFFRPYPEANAAFHAAFKTKRLQFVDTVDSWGHFRSVLIPRATPQGRTYLLAADIAANKVNGYLGTCLQETVLLGLILLVSTLPLLLLYAWPLKQRLYINPLTGLPNRNRLEQDLRAMSHPLIALINIDGFHQINDFYGADNGNRFLRKVARAIQGLLPSKGRLYKLGADEYVVALDTADPPTVIETMMAQLNREHIDLAGTLIRLSVSAGVTRGAAHALEHADLALKEARQLNREVVVYSKQLHSARDCEMNLEWTRRLKDAIDDGRVMAWFQPIHDNLWGGISHYETLVRLVETDGRITGPSQFLSVARRSRLLGRLSLIMLDQALAQAEATGQHYSVNLTADNLIDPDNAAALLERLRQSPAARQIILEIVESEGIENVQKVRTFIAEVKQLGTAIAIDDFGTGYSNFKHLLELPVDYIKIDGSLIQQLPTSTEARAIVAAIVTFANQLEAKVVAEFVSDATIQQAVMAQKIHLSQGYYFGPPAPPKISPVRLGAPAIRTGDVSDLEPGLENS